MLWWQTFSVKLLVAPEDPGINLQKNLFLDLKTCGSTMSIVSRALILRRDNAPLCSDFRSIFFGFLWI